MPPYPPVLQLASKLEVDKQDSESDVEKKTKSVKLMLKALSYMIVTYEEELWPGKVLEMNNGAIVSCIKRLEKYYENIIGEYQAGFHAGRSTIDQIYSVKGMTEKFWEDNLNLYHLFVDFKTAYDSINRQGLYKIMIHQGIHPKIIRLVKMTMAKTMAQVKIYGGSTEQFNIDNGLKQGDALAPMLFNLALHWMITQTGIDPNSTLVHKSVQIVGYADDLDVMERSLTAIEEVYKDLEQGAAKIGLQINASKTKQMTQIRNKQNIYNPPNLTINMFEETEKFKYLGTEFVRQLYIEYIRIPDTDPPKYDFRWGQRAEKEVSRRAILEFVSMIHGKSAINTWTSQYQEMLKAEEKDRETD
ncbi:hypothetical protein ANN_14052 [Periplaneta americana]|uniref:Reverse transcriptase domain-containing protein n=1 Tax=Periplaneta americana TaxID=6978 RepID=A0ABQ8SVU0_PERAM|nr:hypothetical protein ANN_14052 [Periplaneta americana]